MWHASAAPFGLAIAPLLEGMALRALEGVGDADLGEWREWTGRAFHIRRRLSRQEETVTGPVVDVRGTPEEASRRAAVQRVYPWVTEAMG